MVQNVTFCQDAMSGMGQVAPPNLTIFKTRFFCSGERVRERLHEKGLI